jgi:putative membrane protein
MSLSKRRIHAAHFATLVLVGSFALSSCKSEKKSDVNATTTDSSAATAPAPANTAAPSLTDPQVAMIAVVANSADSAAGVQAKEKAMNPDVKGFAQTMITDHTAVNKQATELAKKLNVTPSPTDASQKLQSDADNARNGLASKTGKDYDKAYIDNEVAYHQAVLDALDKQLSPSAQNAELKNLLTQVRPAVAAHLDRAKAIQGRLGS